MLVNAEPHASIPRPSKQVGLEKAAMLSTVQEALRVYAASKEISTTTAPFLEPIATIPPPIASEDHIRVSLGSVGSNPIFFPSAAAAIPSVPDATADVATLRTT